MQLHGARVAITGASSGIGAAAAEAFARQGARLALAGRDTAALEQVAQRCRSAGAAEVRVRAVDVTRAADLAAWAAELREAWGALDVAVANAGVGHYGPFATHHADHWEQLVQTNLVGVWRTAQALLPLLARGQGQLIVVGSVAGRVAMPYLSTYCATKAALVAWTRGVRPELALQGIAVTLFAPGSVRTPFARHALRDRAVRGTALAEPGQRRTDLDKAMGRGWTAERVGQAMVRAARRRPREVHLTLQGKAGIWASAVAPHLLARIVEPWMRPRAGGGGAGNWKH